MPARPRSPRRAVVAGTLVTIAAGLAGCAAGPAWSSEIFLDAGAEARLDLDPASGGWVGVRNRGPGPVTLDLDHGTAPAATGSVASVHLGARGNFRAGPGDLRRIVIGNRSLEATTVIVESSSDLGVATRVPGVPGPPKDERQPGVSPPDPG